MNLALYEHPDGVETEAGIRVVYDVAREEAHFGAAHVEGQALVWELGEREEDAKLSAELELETGEWLLRCDRVDFPPGGIAYRHTHPGPGIRCLLSGSIRIETQGSSRDYRPFEAWFERGLDPVYAAASETEDSAFVRVMVLPTEWRGQRTIHYVDPADEAKPKLQRARVFFDESIFL